MKTILLKNDTSISVEYPFIAQHKNGSPIIVLFSSGTKGMVIYSGSEYGNPVGTYSECWNIFTSPEDWDILKDVTINFKT